ncbi:MAG: hypothetical protein PHV32_12845, partial [Eubacteriales bacterium]|nr:hypothetical protein [Eubacteriales bacterium]
MRKYILSLAIAIVAAIILVLYFVTPQIDYSPLENRTMKMFSTLKDTSYFEGTFQTDLEKALKDQLSFRDSVIMSFNNFRGSTRKVYNSVADFFSNTGRYIADAFSPDTDPGTDPANTSGTQGTGSSGSEPSSTTSTSTTGTVPPGFYDTSQEYYSTEENAGWQQKGLFLDKAYTGEIKIEFGMSAAEKDIDGSVDFTDADFVVNGFSDLALLVRMHENFFDVRNGDKGQQADALVPVIPKKEYRVEIHADIDKKLYTVFVTPPEGEKIMIAENYSFRETAAHANDIGQVYLISAYNNDLIRLSNLKVEGDGEEIEPPVTEPTTPAQTTKPGGSGTQPATSATTGQTTEPSTGHTTSPTDTVPSEPPTEPTEPTEPAEPTEPEPESFWLEPAGSVYKINGTNQLTYYPFLEKSSKKNNYKILANQISDFASKNPNIKVYAYYINKTEDLNWFDKSEKIRTFDYAYYLRSFLSDKVRFDEFGINKFSEMKKYLYETDHHWNHAGGHRGYTEIIDMIRKDFDDVLPAKEPLKEDDFGKDIKWYGSKWKAAGGIYDVLPDSFKAYKYDLGRYKAFYGGSLRDIGLELQYDRGNISDDLMFDHYVQYYGYESQLIRFTFTNPESKYNFLLVGDSNNRPIRKVLGSHFNNFYFIEKRILNQYNLDNFVEENKIDIVLFLGESDFWEMY